MIYYIVPFFIGIIFIFALFKKKNAYEAFINGAREGMDTAIKVFPYVLSMIFATSVFKASSLMDDIFSNVNITIPYELIIQGFIRPISGNAALANMVDIFTKYGVDSIEGIASSILEGSSDTTIYIITLYFGSVGIVNYKYALKVGLLSDFIGFFLTLFCLYYL